MRFVWGRQGIFFEYKRVRVVGPKLVTKGGSVLFVVGF